MKERLQKKMRKIGYNWLDSADKYIRVGGVQEPRYWIAPYARTDQSGGVNPVNAKYARSFSSLKEIEEFLNER